MSNSAEEVNPSLMPKHLQVEVSSAPKSGSPSSESRQGARKTPIKKRDLDEFKSPS
jgi:hypothetical protein